MESTDLVAYAQGDSWALPKPIWQNLAAHINEQNITVTVQTPNGGATSVNFQIAPVGAGGSMVFWSADPKAVGKMGVETIAQPDRHRERLVPRRVHRRRRLDALAGERRRRRSRSPT